MFVALIYACLINGTECQFASATTYYPDEYGCRVEAFRMIEEIKAAGKFHVLGGTCVPIDTKML